MTALRTAVKDYLDTRRALGFELRRTGYLLERFVSFLEHEGARHITTELAVAWATLPRSATPRYHASRLTQVRRFAAWRKATDPRTEVPPQGLLPYRCQRKVPFIYTDEQLTQLLAAARALPSEKGLRGLTYSALFGLIIVTGMRVSEAIALDREHVNLDEGIVTIRRTKFGKTRKVPLHESTCVALRRYSIERDRLSEPTTTPAFFLSELRSRVTGCSSRYNFAWASRHAGLRGPVLGHRHGRGPRIHDLRHRFAVKTLIRWYRAGVDPEREMPKLSTFLGHVHGAGTYWYIQAVPELLHLATRRLERRAKEVRP